MIKRTCPKCDQSWYSADAGIWQCSGCGTPLTEADDKPINERRDVKICNKGGEIPEKHYEYKVWWDPVLEVFISKVHETEDFIVSSDGINWEIIHEWLGMACDKNK